MHSLGLYVIGVLFIISIDIIYLNAAKGFYYDNMKHLIAPELRKLPAVLAWSIMVLGITQLVLPSVGKNDPNGLNEVTKKGAILGFCLYGVYNMTNMATLKDWSYELAIGDTIWGTILTAGTSAFLYALNTQF